MPLSTKTFALSALTLASLVAMVYVIWPVSINTVEMSTVLADNPAPATDKSTALQQQPIAETTTQQTSTRDNERCSGDETQRVLQYYRQLAPQAWRALNSWQSERGLSQTRLRADGALSQEPSPYLSYDISTLSQLARNEDAEAQYWLAMKYRESSEPTTDGGQIYDDRDSNSEDKNIVIPRLLSTAADLGHVQAMLAMGNYFYEQAITHTHTNASAAGRLAVADFPDLQIKARAWQHVAAWRLGRLPDRDTALPNDLEQQSAQLAAQLIDDIRLRREQQGLAPLDNIVPDVLIGLLQVTRDENCNKTTAFTIGS